MGCFSYVSPQCSINSSYLRVDGTVGHGSTYCITDYLDIQNFTIEVVTVDSNYRGNCFYDSNKTLISCVASNEQHVGNNIIIPDNSVYFRYSFATDRSLPVYKICSSDPTTPEPVAFDHFYYLPDNLINENYTYYFDGDKFIIQTDSTSCVDVFPHTDYLVSDVYTCDPVGATIPYSSFSSSPSYRVDFPSILLIIFIFMVGIVFLLSALCHSLFKGVFK